MSVACNVVCLHRSDSPFTNDSCDIIYLPLSYSLLADVSSTSDRRGGWFVLSQPQLSLVLYRFYGHSSDLLHGFSTQVWLCGSYKVQTLQAAPVPGNMKHAQCGC